MACRAVAKGLATSILRKGVSLSELSFRAAIAMTTTQLRASSLYGIPSGTLNRSPSQQRLLGASGHRHDQTWLQQVASRALPGELWGAVNVLTAAARGFSASSSLTCQGGHSTSQAIATAAVEMSAYDEDGQRENEKRVETLRQRLDFKPQLSALDNAMSAVIPAGICGILFWVTQPAKISLLYALGLTMIYAAWVAICRAVLLERHYAARLVPESELGDKDSCFARLDGTTVHYKAVQPAIRNPKAAIHCFHGFGANTGSWTAVHRKMADALDAQVTTHDMPGFGLTERPADLGKYSLDFNGRLGRQVMDTALASALPGSSKSKPHDSASSFALIQPESATRLGQKGSVGEGECAKAAEDCISRVFLGHSLGGACAAAEAILNPEGVDALILVAPAVMAFGFLARSEAGKAGDIGCKGGSCTVTFDVQPPVSPVVKSTKRQQQKNLPLRLAVALTQASVALISGILTRILEPITVVTLRSAVRSRAFWERGLGRAWHEKAGVTPEIVDAYRQPQLVKGWEKGLVRFTAARLSGGKSIVAVLRDAWNGTLQPTQAELLAEAVSKHQIKVLIVHGQNDALVPASNSRRLAALLPTSQLVIMENTGHVPHEEHPKQFLEIVQRFMDSLEKPY